MKLLDTTFLIHYWGGVDDAADYLESHEDEEFLTTTLNLKEIAVGRRLQGKLDRAEILTTFDWVTLVPFDAEHAFVAAELEANLRQQSDINEDRINALAGDLLIAAVAKERNASVVTENTRDFALFDGVPVDTYR
ncbi:PIN domain-containing protein [Halolamina sediminis]|uniref:PIN domain-containing protein n=1 Tax=Halolamina sediminis TaxID=1480675 RepID=UPI0006B60D0D|nr:PIN domain-containing protein [Halolamina sediminis]